MADIFGAIKKRFGADKAKEPEHPLDQATYDALSELKAKLAENPREDYSAEFSNVVKDFFRSLLKLRYHFTHEELVSEISRRRFVPEIKQEMADYINKLNQQQYSPGGFKRAQLETHMNLFEELVAKATSDSARPYKKKKSGKDKKKSGSSHSAKAKPISSKEKMPGDGKPEPETHRPALIPALHSILKKKEPEEELKSDTEKSTLPLPTEDSALLTPPAPPELKQDATSKKTASPKISGPKEKPGLKKSNKLSGKKTSSKLDSSKIQAADSKLKKEQDKQDIQEESFKKFSGLFKGKLEVAPKKQEPEPPKDTLSEMYSLFKKAYNSIKDKQADDAKSLLDQINALNKKLDRKDRAHFKEEISNLNKEIKQLQKEILDAKRQKDRQDIIDEKAQADKFGPKDMSKSPGLHDVDELAIPAPPALQQDDKKLGKQKLEAAKPSGEISEPKPAKQGILSIFRKKQPQPEEELVLPKLPEPSPEGPLPGLEIPAPPKPQIEEPATSPISKKASGKKKQTSKNQGDGTISKRDKKQDDKVVQIYEHFKTAYDHLNNGHISEADSILSKINEAHKKLDKEVQAKFKSEISHLSQKIDYLEKKAAKKAKKEKEKEKEELKEQQKAAPSLLSSEQAISKEGPAPISEPAQPKPRRKFFLFGKKEPEPEPLPSEQPPLSEPAPLPAAPISAPALETPDELEQETPRAQEGKKKSKKGSKKGSATPAKVEAQPKPGYAEDEDLLAPPQLEEAQLEEDLTLPALDTLPRGQEIAPSKKPKPRFSLFKKKEPEQLPAIKPMPDVSLPEPITAQDTFKEPPMLDEEPVDVLKHSIKKKPFSKKQAEPEPVLSAEKPGPAGIAALEAEAIEPPSIEETPSPSDKKKHSKQIKPKKAAPPKSPPPPPPKIHDLLQKEPPAAPEEMPYPRKFTFIPQSDIGSEITHEPLKVETFTLEEPVLAAPLEDKLSAELLLQGEKKKEKAPSSGGMFGKKPGQQKRHVPIQEPILQSQPEELPAPMLVSVPDESPSLQKLVPISDEERLLLIKLSGHISSMKEAVAAGDMSEAEQIWGQIADIKATLSPSLTNMMEPIVQDIGNAMEMIEIEVIQSKQAVPSFLNTNPKDYDGDHNQRILDIIKGTAGIAQVRKLEKDAGRSALARSSSPIPANKPKLTKKEAEEQRDAQAILDFNQALGQAKIHLQASRLDEANEAYRRALSLKRQIKVDEAEKNRLTYELMDLNVALRMAKIK